MWSEDVSRFHVMSCSSPLSLWPDRYETVFPFLPDWSFMLVSGRLKECLTGYICFYLSFSSLNVHYRIQMKAVKVTGENCHKQSDIFGALFHVLSLHESGILIKVND